MTFLGDFHSGSIKEVSLERSMVINYVQQLFKRTDFPQEIFIVLSDSTIASKGDVVWANMDNEHPHDFVPIACIDQLVLNLPTKEQFLKDIGYNRFEEIDIEAENKYWKHFHFDLAGKVRGLKLIWS